MSLDHTISNASLERVRYHQLASRELDKLNDAEALYERGRRLRNGIGVAKNEEAGWQLAIEAAKLGHPVALAFCFHYGRGTAKNPNRAAELYRASAERGHAGGSLRLLVSRESFAFPQTLTNPNSSVRLGVVLREQNWCREGRTKSRSLVSRCCRSGPCGCSIQLGMVLRERIRR